MKSMLYVGATLMIGASIYGFVDYKQTSNQKEFTSMYESGESKAPAVAEERKEEPIVKKESRAPVKKTKNNSRKVLTSETKETEIVPAIEPISGDEVINEKETKEITTSAVEIKTSGTSAVKKTKKKKLNSKLFSRAPLREDREMVIEPVKAETKKKGDKED